MKGSVTKELEEATLDAAGLRRLIHIKNQELKHMKALAATILSQRTETEQFFLESLQEVKEVIVKEKKKSYNEARTTLNKLKAGTSEAAKSKTSAFPPLVVKAANLHHMESKTVSDLPVGALEKVTIKDLSWEDKELVLRVLFSKMNGNQTAINKAVTQTYRPSGKMPAPVFLSEGAGAFAPDSQEYAGAAQYQGNFEVDYRENEDDGDGDGDASPPLTAGAYSNADDEMMSAKSMDDSLYNPSHSQMLSNYES